MQAITSGKTGLAPGMKRVSDWVGMRVVTVTPLRNGNIEIPSGTIATVVYARAGLELRTDPCKCCGVRVRITRVPAYDVRPAIEPAEAGNP